MRGRVSTTVGGDRRRVAQLAGAVGQRHRLPRRQVVLHAQAQRFRLRRADLLGLQLRIVALLLLQTRGSIRVSASKHTQRGPGAKPTHPLKLADPVDQRLEPRIEANTNNTNTRRRNPNTREGYRTHEHEVELVSVGVQRPNRP